MIGLILNQSKSFTSRVLQLRDRFRRYFARLLFDRRNLLDARCSNEIVFVRWDAKLGDTVVLSWVWRELRVQRPDLKISVITAPAFEPLLRQSYRIESVYTAPKRHGWRVIARLGGILHRPKYVVHLAGQFKARDMFFVRKLRPAHVVGLDDELQMVDIKLGQLTAGVHFSEKLIPWLNSIGVKTVNRQYWIPGGAHAKAAVDRWWPFQRTVIGFCPYGASEKRRLSDAWIKTIVSKIAKTADVRVLMLLTAADCEKVAKCLAGQPWSNQIIYQPTQDILELFEQVRRCEVIVSVDTAIVHVAAGLSKPMLALYVRELQGDSNFLAWHPNSGKALVLHTVPSIDQSINSLDATKVTESIGKLLA